MLNNLKNGDIDENKMERISRLGKLAILNLMHELLQSQVFS